MFLYLYYKSGCKSHCDGRPGKLGVSFPCLPSFFLSIYFYNFEQCKYTSMFKDIIILLPFFVCLFWTAVLLTDLKKSKFPIKILSIFMTVSTVLYFSHALYFYGYIQAYSFIDPLYIFTSLSVYPIFYIYIISLADKPKPALKNLSLFLPAIIGSLLSLIAHLFFEQLADVAGKLSRVIFVVQVPMFVIYGGNYIRNYHKKIREFYSSTEGRELGWLNRMLFLLMFTGLLSVAAGILGRDYFADNPVMLMIPSLLFATMLFYIGHTGYIHKFSVVDFNIDNNEKVSNEDIKDTHHGIQDKTREKLQNDIVDLFEKKQFFKRTDLRITDVSAELGTNRSYVSAVVNTMYNSNFKDFVNHYRVEYAKKLLKAEENHILDYIAEESGFASVNSLLRAFRKETGTTPGQFRKKTF